MFSQVVYFTATFPYVLLVAITAYGLTLPGALDGVKELFVPKAWTGPKTITDPQVWRKAAEQMFYSLSVSFVVKKLNITICTHQVSWGGLVMFGSYNKFGHKVHITAATTLILDNWTSSPPSLPSNITSNIIIMIITIIHMIKVHITAATISSLDFLTSIISGLAVFSILGNLAHQQNVEVI